MVGLVEGDLWVGLEIGSRFMGSGFRLRALALLLLLSLSLLPPPSLLSLLLLRGRVSILQACGATPWYAKLCLESMLAL